MSDCSGIRKVYMRPEKNNNEHYSFENFLLAIESSIESLDNEEIDIITFADAICAECNKIEDFFPTKPYDDCIITSKYILVDEDELYCDFTYSVKNNIMKYKEEKINHYQLCNSIIDAKKNLFESLESLSYSKVKTNIK